MLLSQLEHPDLLSIAQSQMRWMKDGKPMHGVPPAVRVLARCVVVGECWEFQGNRNVRGYGAARRRGRMEPAHRIVFTELNGPLDRETFVCHSCDNPPCCNPAHLWAGTALDNSRDCAEKGRLPNPWANRVHVPKTHCKQGHEFTPENTYWYPNGRYRGCRTCRSASWGVAS